MRCFGEGGVGWVGFLREVNVCWIGDRCEVLEF